jgi:hypothetical protein
MWISWLKRLRFVVALPKVLSKFLLLQMKPSMQKKRRKTELDLFPLLQIACILIEAELISFQLVGETS